MSNDASLMSMLGDPGEPEPKQMTPEQKRIAIATDSGLNEDWWSDSKEARAAAVELLEALRREHGFGVEAIVTEDEWIVMVFQTGTSELIFTVSASTFPAAVAEAYGRARNLWPAT